MAYHSANLNYALKYHETDMVDKFAHNTANMCMMILDAYNAWAEWKRRD